MKNRCNCLILFLLLGLLSCGEAPENPANQPKELMKSSMEKANRYLLNEEETDIRNYMNRHHLDMVSTGTGLRYQILKRGTGNQIENGQMVAIEYELHSLKGDLIYSSDKDGVKSFVVGDGTVESGLDEAVSHLHYGDVAKVIIPFHLAYGMHGDGNRIPEYATLVYLMKIIENQ